MKRPSFQFYPADWRSNANLRRCSEAARGAWMDILGTLHDSNEYGIVRWPLAELARAAGVALRLAKELADKCVLKGADRGPVKYVHTPRHAGKNLSPVTLVEVVEGPCWFSSRMVKDEWLRGKRGGETRFSSDNQPDQNSTPDRPPTGSPNRRVGDVSGDGATTSSSSASSEEVSSLRSDSSAAAPASKPPSVRRKTNKTMENIVFPPWWPHEKWEAFVQMRRERRAALTADAVELAVKKLTAMRNEGQDPVAVLEQSIMNSYKGLFPVKQEDFKNGGQPANRSFASNLTRAVRERNSAGMLGGGGPEIVVSARPTRPPGDSGEDRQFGDDADAA